tara:strand:- start:554 stop:1450 length:897 start_codon:yes stop_codon:yes gene_type:complete
LKDKIVIGTWPISGDWGPIDTKSTINILEQAYFKYGFKEFDTAPNYGNGFSEFILGKIFYNQKDVVFNTKVGSQSFGGKSFEIDDIKRSVNESLQRLNCQKINTIFLHNPRSEITNYDKVLNLLSDYKSQKIIRYIGLSCAKNYDYSEILNNVEFDFIQDDINLLSLSPLKKLNKQKIYARSPLASGLLSGRINKNTVFNKSDHRAEWLKGERLISICKRLDVLRNISPQTTIIDLALRFMHHNKEVYKTIYGIKKINHLNNLIRLIKLPPLTNSEIKSIYKAFNNDYGLYDEKHLAY